MPVDTRINIPFIPSEGVTSQILNAIQLANEQHRQQQQLGLQQQQLAQQAPLVQSEADRNTQLAAESHARILAGEPQADVDAKKATTEATQAATKLHQQVDPINAASDLATLRATNARLQFMGLPTVPEPGQPSGQPAPVGVSPIDQQLDSAVKSLGSLSGDEQAALSAARAERMQTGGDPKAFTEAIKDIASNRRSVALANAAIGSRKELQAPVREDRAYQFIAGQIDKYAQPVSQWEQRAGRLKDTLAQGTAQADALVAPELLSIMAGGQGSGVRMNEAEIARIVGGRTQLESFRAMLNKYSTDPQHFSIPADQRAAASKLIDMVSQKVDSKSQILDDARQGLVTASSPQEMKKIYADTLGKLTAVDVGKPEAKAAAPSGGGKTFTYNPATGKLE